jgi:uncharacterized caspase-like protein
MPLNPNHFAVCVGIDHYPAFRPLKGAVNDAVDFSEWLLNEGGLPIDQVETILLDPDADLAKLLLPEAKPSRTQVFHRLADFQNRFKLRLDQDPYAWDTSRLYIYMSGHGLSSDIQDAALLLANSSPDMLGENISCARLISYFGNAQYFKEVVVFADCCRERADDFEVGNIPLTPKKNKFGRMSHLLGFAAGFGELAFEESPTPQDNGNPDETRGFFTQALIECLRAGSADPNDPDGVDSLDLARRVPQRVAELTKSRPKPQIPSIIPDGGMPIKFSRSPDQGALSKVVIELAGPALHTLVVVDAKAEEVGRIPIGNQVLQLDLPRQQYRVRPEDGNIQEGGYFEVKGGDLHVRI